THLAYEHSAMLRTGFLVFLSDRKSASSVPSAVTSPPVTQLVDASLSLFLTRSPTFNTTPYGYKEGEGLAQ
ncbi:hypothetical protein J6590_065827, partial [Homalodisca vitripennis]